MQFFYIDYLNGDKKERNIGFLKADHEGINVGLHGVPVQCGGACKVYAINEFGTRCLLGQVPVKNGNGMEKFRWAPEVGFRDCVAVEIPLYGTRIGKCVLREQSTGYNKIQEKMGEKKELTEQIDVYKTDTYKTDAYKTNACKTESYKTEMHKTEPYIPYSGQRVEFTARQQILDTDVNREYQNRQQNSYAENELQQETNEVRNIDRQETREHSEWGNTSRENMPRETRERSEWGNTSREEIQRETRKSNEWGNPSRQENISNIAADKWTQLMETYPRVHIFPEAQSVLIKPKDLIVLTEKYHEMATNSFVLHAYYNYRQLLLFCYPNGAGNGQNADAQQQGNGQPDAGSRTSVHAADNSYGSTPNAAQSQSKTEYYLGVPGTYYERECRIAEMFGFEGFENGEARMHDEIDRVAHTGCFGYYMKRVEI